MTESLIVDGSQLSIENGLTYLSEAGLGLVKRSLLNYIHQHGTQPIEHFTHILECIVKYKGAGAETELLINEYQKNILLSKHVRSELILDIHIPLKNGLPEKHLKYVYKGRLGAGGQGEVFHAHEIDENLEKKRDVAVKMFKPNTSDRKLLDREIQILHHFGTMHEDLLPSFHGAFRIKGKFHIIMEYVPGDSLRKYYNKQSALHPRSPIDPIVALKFLRCVALVLQTLHNPPKLEQRCVHRDIKPDNLIVSGNKLIVVDFGLGKRHADMNMPATLAGFFGTPGYTNTELYRISSTHLHPKVDIFASGAVLCFMFLGVPPHYPLIHWNPSLNEVRASAPENQLDISLFRPDIPETVIRLIEDCLEWDHMSLANGSQLLSRIDACLDFLRRDGYSPEPYKSNETNSLCKNTRNRLDIAVREFLSAAEKGNFDLRKLAVVLVNKLEDLEPDIEKIIAAFESNRAMQILQTNFHDLKQLLTEEAGFASINYIYSFSRHWEKAIRPCLEHVLKTLLKLQFSESISP